MSDLDWDNPAETRAERLHAAAFDMLQYATDVTALGQLAELLNGRYGLQQAELYSDRDLDHRAPYVAVAWGASPDHVVAAVKIEHRPEADLLSQDVFVIHVFTSAGWYEYGQPFIVLEHVEPTGVARLIDRYVPFHPAT